ARTTRAAPAERGRPIAARARATPRTARPATSPTTPASVLRGRARRSRPRPGEVPAPARAIASTGLRSAEGAAAPCGLAPCPRGSDTDRSSTMRTCLLEQRGDERTTRRAPRRFEAHGASWKKVHMSKGSAIISILISFVAGILIGGVLGGGSPD